MVMQVNKVTFQRKEVAERAELKTDGMYQVCTTGSISYISTISTSRSQRLTVRAMADLFPGDTAECCSVSDISI